MSDTIGALLDLAREDVSAPKSAPASAPASDGAELRRDAEVLLCALLQQSRSYLYTRPEAVPDEALAAEYRRQLEARRRGVPVAYLTGVREFWSLPLSVNEHTLIPRADTERLVEVALDCALPDDAKVLDLGTGSGAIALALASERPRWQVTAVDISVEALTLARSNGDRLISGTVRWLQGSWFEPVEGESFDLIVANPPYLDSDDPHLQEGDLRFEPRQALVAGGGALAEVDSIVEAAPAHLRVNGWLLLEHGCEQGLAVRDRLQRVGLGEVETWQDLAGLDRVSGGQWSEMW